MRKIQVLNLKEGNVIFAENVLLVFWNVTKLLFFLNAAAQPIECFKVLFKISISGIFFCKVVETQM